MGNLTEAARETPLTRQGTVVAPPPYSASEGASAAHAAPSYEAVSRNGNVITSGVAGVSNRFPQSLNAYFPKMKFSKTFHLGEHADQLRFAVTMHSGLTSKPWLELHAGPSESDPIVATADNEKKWGSGRNFVVQVIPIPESAAAGSSATSTPAQQQQDWQLSPQAIRIQQKHDWKQVQYPFSAEVGLGKDVRREDFEWRRSRGGEVQQLDKHAGYGWKRMF